MTVQTHDFEADTGKILNIVINSLYSDRDIFLRELLSNASDAIHKRKFLGQTEPQLLNSSEDEISINVDEKKKTIEIIDTGIGLSADDLTETFGTIARSGTSTQKKKSRLRSLFLRGGYNRLHGNWGEISTPRRLTWKFVVLRLSLVSW